MTIPLNSKTLWERIDRLAMEGMSDESKTIRICFGKDAEPSIIFKIDMGKKHGVNN
jgi:hypothetical protein